MKRLLSILCALACASFTGYSQFYSVGTDPASARWKYLESNTYRIIYPEGLDSLARVYASSLESFRPAVGNSAGMAPNEFYSKKMPVVLHPFTAYSNGSVAWAPRGMNLYTNPEAYEPEATPWVEQLSLHESRHVAQMQLGRLGKGSRFLNALTGELWTGAAAGIFPGPALLEGDAVVAETALSRTGRGRTADFLEYYKVALADSLYRDFWQWRWGSQKRYTPDHYRAGYVLTAGMRLLYDCPDFTARYFRRLGERFMPVNNLGKTIREASGKSFKASFREIQEYFAEQWKEEDAQRGPFTEGSAVTAPGRLFDSYQSLAFAGDSLFAIHSGLDCNRELVLLDSLGERQHIKYLPSLTSKLAWNDFTGQLMWSEHKASALWDLASSSVICTHALGVTYAIGKGHKYYNPAPRPGSGTIAVASYNDDGSAAVRLIGITGDTEADIPAPSGIQPVEPVWVGDKLYVSAIEGDGFGIYDTDGWVSVLKAAPLKINHLFSRDGLVWFVSDLDGANNLYSLDPVSGELLQRTCMQHGGQSFAFSPSGDLYYTSLQSDGRTVRKLRAGEMCARPAEFKARRWPMADRLSRQEAVRRMDYTGEISEGKPYSKLSHLFKFHSWAPASVEYDYVEKLSMESVDFAGGPGVSAFFQNDLGTSSGIVSVGLASPADTLGTGLLQEEAGLDFRPSLHLQYSYSGLPVVLEFRADINSRTAHRHDIRIEKSGENSYSLTPFAQKKGNAYWALSARAYLPVNLSGGGWNRGIIPSVRIGLDNDEFGTVEYNRSKGFLKGKSSGPLTQLSLRAYSHLPVNPSGIYPRWGIGAEAGVMDCGRVTVSWPVNTWTSKSYARLYSYIPGLLSTHGIRLEANYEHNYGSSFASYSDLLLKADYAIPFGAVDWSGLSPAFYLRNFEAVLHAGYERFAVNYKTGNQPLLRNVSSFALTLQARVSNFLWVPYDSRIGLKWGTDNFNGNSVEMVFSLDI